MEESAGRELWPSFLSKVAAEYQQPIFEMQKRFLSSVKYGKPADISCHMHNLHEGLATANDSSQCHLT